MKKIDLKNKKVGVLGFGRSGIASANMAVKYGAKVLISDIGKKQDFLKNIKLLDKNIQYEFEQHSDKLLDSDLIIKSPGISNNIDIIKKIKKRNIPILGEIEFASRFIQTKGLIGITGTNGKTTTTALIGEIFKKAGLKTVVGGNIGAPLAGMIDKIDTKTFVILELSSYQLEDSCDFHPNICAVLNITPDHIEHHTTMKNYIDAKARIFKNQTQNDYCILNYDDLLCRKLAKKCKSKIIFFSRKKKLKTGVFYSNGMIFVKIGRYNLEFPSIFKIPGMHNIENGLAAIAAALAAGIKVDVIKNAVSNFHGVEHRIELCAEKNGVKYYNDSKATNVDSTRVAIESFEDPIWLILGGKDKGASYDPLKSLIKEKVKGIMLIGEASNIIKKSFEGLTNIYNCKTLENAVKKAKNFARSGEIVLLSPACASFDQFKNFEDRGRQFKKIVSSM